MNSCILQRDNIPLQDAVIWRAAETSNRERQKKQMKTFAQVIGFVVLAILGIGVLLGLGWLIQGNDFFMYKYFAPKYEDARRQVFENTKSYNQGMIQELQNMQIEYGKSEPSQQKMIASVILQRTADFPDDRLPEGLREFVQQFRRERTGGSNGTKSDNQFLK